MDIVNFEMTNLCELIGDVATCGPGRIYIEQRKGSCVWQKCSQYAMQYIKSANETVKKQFIKPSGPDNGVRSQDLFMLN